jgi:hypothetical protein
VSAPVAPHPADAEALEAVFARADLQTTMPEPSWTGYLQVLAEGIARWLGDWLDPLFRALGARGDILGPLAWAFVGGTVLLLVLGIARLAVGAWRRRSPLAGGAARTEHVPAPPRERDRLAWRREVERRLAEGKVKEALEAIWWWMARSLCPERAHRSWTSGDLLHAARRLDLVPLSAALDALAYAPRRPDHDEVRRLLDSLEAALA